MSIIKKATLEDVKIKMMVWGEAGSGKSRFSLTAPKPLVIDLENSTRLYSGEFDFYKSTIDSSNKKTSNPTLLTLSVLEELEKGSYKNEIETLIIDPVTDLLDSIEQLCTKTFENDILKNKKVTDLNPLEKTKFYAFRRNKSREMIDKILNLDLNVIFIARAKNVWTTTSNGMAPTGKTYDGIDILEYLPDVVVNVELKEEKRFFNFKKCRVGKIENCYIETWQDFIKLINKKISKKDIKVIRKKDFSPGMEEINKSIDEAV
jgi:hypothetical protein